MRLSDCFIVITSKSAGSNCSDLACKRNLEGIVAKRKFDPYLTGNAKRYKIGMATTRSRYGEKNYSSGNALPIPTGTTGTCAHRHVIC